MRSIPRLHKFKQQHLLQHVRHRATPWYHEIQVVSLLPIKMQVITTTTMLQENNSISEKGSTDALSVECPFRAQANSKYVFKHLLYFAHPYRGSLLTFELFVLYRHIFENTLVKNVCLTKLCYNRQFSTTKNC